MKGCIFFYSGSGNTKLACQYIARNVRSVEFTLIDIVGAENPDLAGYGFCGFATFADFVGPPRLFIDFVKSLPAQPGKPAFVLNTFGGFNGRIQLAMAALAKNRGFNVLAGHALRMPENYPPLIAKGRGAKQAPDDAELAAFQAFARDLDRIGADLQAGRTVKARPIRIVWPGILVPAMPRKAARWDMGKKLVDANACTACGLCRKLCPYGAVELNPKPVFDEKKCYGCWACYNHCPAKAIYTRKYHGIGHYPEPIEAVRKKLEA